MSSSRSFHVTVASRKRGFGLRKCHRKPSYDMTVIDFNKNDAFVKKINCDVCFDTLGILNDVCFDMANPMIVKTSNKNQVNNLN